MTDNLTTGGSEPECLKWVYRKFVLDPRDLCDFWEFLTLQTAPVRVLNTHCVFAMVEGPGNKLKGEKMKSIVVGQVLSKVLSLQL